MRISWLRTALANLGAIGNTIARDNPVAARETVPRIVTAIDALAQNPQLDTSRPGRVAGTRELVVTPNYLVPYRIKNSTLEVPHVMHARQRWPDRLP
jgi:plasmid stabilization system protein ParE